MIDPDETDPCFHPVIKVRAVQPQYFIMQSDAYDGFHPVIKVRAVQQHMDDREFTVVGFHPVIKVRAVQLKHRLNPRSC